MKTTKTATIQGVKLTASKILKLDREQLSGGDYAVTIPDLGDVGFRCYNFGGFGVTPDSGDVSSVALVVIANGIRRNNSQYPGSLIAILAA